MAIFKDAYQARLKLKMSLSNFAWYSSSAVVNDKNDGYSVVVMVKKIDNIVRKLIPPVLDYVSIKTEMEKG